jgi:hypothetical protein
MGRPPWVRVAGLALAVGAGACSSTSRPGADEGTGPPLEAGAHEAGALEASALEASALDTGGTTSESGASDASSGDASAAGDSGALSLAACREGNTWSTVARVPSIASAGFDRFGAISAGALTVAWTTSAGVIEVADRTSNTGAFGAPAALDPGTIQLANDRVALAPSGLLLVAPLAQGNSFAGFVRSSIQSPWVPDPSNPDPFHTLASRLSETGGAFTQPVVSADGLSFFYLAAVGQEAPALYESTWDATLGEWTYGSPLTDPEFAAPDAAGQVRRPTGASSDRRTLFFFDEASGTERAAWRASPTSPFSQFVNLPGLPEAAPSGDCVSVYIRGSDSSGPGLFIATGP